MLRAWLAALSCTEIKHNFDRMLLAQGLQRGWGPAPTRPRRASTAAAGAVAGRFVAADRAPAGPGDSLADVDTPALLLDLDGAPRAWVPARGSARFLTHRLMMHQKACPCGHGRALCSVFPQKSVFVLVCPQLHQPSAIYARLFSGTLGYESPHVRRPARRFHHRPPSAISCLQCLRATARSCGAPWRSSLGSPYGRTPRCGCHEALTFGQP
jgi:hypothetical protein